jgi:hypothetical protein
MVVLAYLIGVGKWVELGVVPRLSGRTLLASRVMTYVLNRTLHHSRHDAEAHQPAT